ncbi:MAG: four helix bundle protein [Flavobacteriales bacterium]|nr:four helix bundle protein [Flavobacteriales bacterium]MCB9174481.1 four helix bundle protein [Flavobacteriales bacterium]
MQFTDNPKYKDNVILKLTFEFAVGIVKYSEELDAVRKYSIANQILRSGTSIGANVKEAQNAESKKDFIHKLKIALKEADELEYWLFLCNEVESYPSSNELLEKLVEIKKILNKIVSSSKLNV